MLFLFMLLREKDQKVLYSFEMLLLSEKLLQKYRPAALMIQIVNIDKSEDASVFIRVVLMLQNKRFAKNKASHLSTSVFVLFH